jgi:hypothetical protein
LSLPSGTFYHVGSVCLLISIVPLLFSFNAIHSRLISS